MWFEGLLANLDKVVSSSLKLWLYLANTWKDMLFG